MLPQTVVQDCRADRIGDDRGDRHALHRHTKHDDEEQIEHDVDHACRKQIVERALGVPGGAENAVAEVVDCKCGRAEQIDAHIQDGIRQQLVFRFEHDQQFVDQ